MSRLRRSRVDAQRGVRAGGFSLVELMVGLLVSLIGTLAMMKAFAVFEAQKRTTTSGNDAQQNGSFSLFELERQIRTAGSGLTQGRNYGVWSCKVTAYSSGTQRMPGALPAPFSGWPTSTRAIPVLVADGGVNAAGFAQPDTIAVIGGNPAMRTFKASVASIPDKSTVVTDNTVGIFADDYLLGSDKSGACTLGRAASIDSAAKQITLKAADGPANGFTGAFSGQGYLFDMGAAPVFSLFGIDTSAQTLVTFDLLQRNGSAPISIADGIVQIKALYGVDDGAGGASADDDNVDEWVEPSGTTWGLSALTAGTPAALLAISRIKAVRLAVVAQSELPERSSDYSGPTSLTLFGDVLATPIKVATQSQFRYRVYDTTIPIRNAFITRYY